MLIKFFGGVGGGGGIANYLVDANRESREDAPPEVLRGDIALTRELIDSSDRKWTYSTGVISFAPEDHPTEAQQNALMDDFERLAFAGLERDQYDITWVRHSHTEGGRVELHFLIPRMELSTGKAFNPAPPGWLHAFAPLRDAYNYQHGWVRPDDPARSRTLQWVSERAERGEAREAITEYLEGRILAGQIESRDDIVSALHEAGYETPRTGKNYITARNPETGERFRLKGRVYEKGWTRDAELDRAAARDASGRTGSPRDGDAARAEQARARLQGVIERRAQFNRERYQRPSLDHPTRDQDAGARDGRGAKRDSRQAETDHPDQRPDRRNRDGDLLDRANPVDDVAHGRGGDRDRPDRNLSDPARDRADRLDVSRNSLHQTEGVGDEHSHPDRKSALERVRELGQRIRGFGASAVTAVRAFFGRDGTADVASEPARDAFAASERSLEQTERLNDSADRAGAEIDRAVALKEAERDRQQEFERVLERVRDRQLTR